MNENLTQYMPEKALPGNIDRIFTTIIRQLGAMSHGIQYGDNRRLSEDPDPSIIEGYYQEARMGHADAIIQLIIFGEVMNWGWETQINDGIERFKERMEELRKGVI